MVEGPEPPHQQQVHQEIDVARRRLRTHHQRRREAGGVQQRALIVRQHRPEALQRFGGYPGAEERNLSLQMGANEILAPGETPSVVIGQVRRTRDAAPWPRPPDSGPALSRAGTLIAMRC